MQKVWLSFGDDAAEVAEPAQAVAVGVVEADSGRAARVPAAAEQGSFWFGGSPAGALAGSVSSQSDAATTTAGRRTPFGTARLCPRIGAVVDTAEGASYAR